MKACRLIASLMTALILTSTCAAVDLTKIDRTIQKEPTYQNQPGYCLVVLGPEAKTRVWLVRDGDTLYVDRNSNGDLTEKGKQVKAVYQRIGGIERIRPDLAKEPCSQFLVGEVVDPNGKDKYKLDVTFFPPGLFLPEMSRSNAEKVCQMSCQFQGKTFLVGFPVGPFRFAGKRENAPVIHFGGPLTFGLLGLPGMPDWGEKLTLAGGKKTLLYAYLGTPGLGKAAFAALVGRITNKPFNMDLAQCGKKVPGEVDPKVEIELASQDAKGRPVKLYTLLSGRDCGSKTLEGSIRVPKETGRVGKAKITVSMPDSEAQFYVGLVRLGKVAPATFEVPIVGLEDLLLSEVEAEVMQKLGGALIDIQGKSISAVDFREKPVTDAQLKELAKDFKKLKNLRSLSFVDSAQLTDEGLKELGKELKDLKKLRVLFLGGTGITDAGLKELKELKNLQELGLSRTRVTDEGLKELKELEGLRVLGLFDCAKVTQAAIRDLKTSLPKLRIVR